MEHNTPILHQFYANETSIKDRDTPIKVNELKTADFLGLQNFRFKEIHFFISYIGLPKPTGRPYKNRVCFDVTVCRYKPLIQFM